MFLEPFNFTNPIKDVSDLIKNKELEKRYGNLIIFNIQEQKILHLHPYREFGDDIGEGPPNYEESGKYRVKEHLREIKKIYLFKKIR